MQLTVRALGVALASSALAVGALALPAAAQASDGGAGTGGNDLVLVRDDWGLPPLTTRRTTDRAALTAAEATAPANAFTLHSRPGATRSIFLDFDGGTLTKDNIWRTKGGLADSEVPGQVDASGNQSYPAGPWTARPPSPPRRARRSGRCGPGSPRTTPRSTSTSPPSSRRRAASSAAP